MEEKLSPDAASNTSSLVVAAIANVFALSSTVYIAANISGGHVNPAVTFAKAVSGHITVPTALFYWVSQMLASVMASLLLRVTAIGQVISNLYAQMRLKFFKNLCLELKPLKFFKCLLLL